MKLNFFCPRIYRPVARRRVHAHQTLARSMFAEHAATVRRERIRAATFVAVAGTTWLAVQVCPSSINASLPQV